MNHTPVRNKNIIGINKLWLVEIIDCFVLSIPENFNFFNFILIINKEKTM
jgi:hypothetical protein